MANRVQKPSNGQWYQYDTEADAERTAKELAKLNGYKAKKDENGDWPCPKVKDQE